MTLNVFFSRPLLLGGGGKEGGFLPRGKGLDWIGFCGSYMKFLVLVAMHVTIKKDLIA